jgi:hypothetical protein
MAVRSNQTELLSGTEAAPAWIDHWIRRNLKQTFQLCAQTLPPELQALIASVPSGAGQPTPNRNVS